MKLCFKNAVALEAGIALIAQDLGIKIVTADADVTVSVKEVADTTITVTLDGENAEIVYGGGKARFYRALATLCGWL